MLDQKLNIFFFFFATFVFLLFSEGDDYTRFFLAIALSIITGLICFLLNWLTLSGATSAILFGVIALGLGNITGASIVLVFFITSSLLSKDEKKGHSIVHFRRNGAQVWSNGFWFALWVIIWFASNSIVFLIAALSSISFSTADTWGSEIGGNRIKGTTWQFGSFKKIEPGLDGGVSLMGSLAALVGSFVIGITFFLFNQNMSLGYPILIIITGFLGSFVDSFFGTYIQGKKINQNMPKLLEKRIQTFDNNFTNWISSGLSSILAICIFFFL